MWYHRQNYNLNQRDVYEITECDKYPTTAIFKFSTIFYELIKLHSVHLLKMTPNKKCPILQCRWKQRPNRKLVVIKVSNTSTE